MSESDDMDALTRFEQRRATREAQRDWEAQHQNDVRCTCAYVREGDDVRRMGVIGCPIHALYDLREEERWRRRR